MNCFIPEDEKYREVFPLPEACQKCEELDCSFCDDWGKRWIENPKYTLLSRRRLAEQAVRRYQKIILEIDIELKEIEELEKNGEFYW